MSEIPSAYTAAHEGAAIFDHSYRTRLRVTGRAPGQMLGGVVSGRIPGSPSQGDAGLKGASEYSTVLTPKGRMVSDLFLTRLPGADEEFIVDVSEAGSAALLAHFSRVMPPRFAKVEDISESTRHFSVVGPNAAALLGSASVGSPDTFQALDRDAAWFATEASPFPIVVRRFATTTPCFDVFCDIDAAPALERALLDAGALRGDSDTWEVLRVEAGTPRFGADMTDATIPIEAGIEDRAIDTTKGCYTGQEVIIRILHRGHVNKHLRTIRIRDGNAVEVGAELFSDGAEKSVGHVTSVVDSPRAGALALGYVRREVDVGSSVRLGTVDGAEAEVCELGPVLVSPT